MQISIILGTARKGRQSEKVAKYLLKKVKNNGFESEIIDVRDYRLEATDNTQETEKAKKFGLKIENSDAIIIVSPEYNHSYPGELKMMLDMIYNQYKGKPAGLCGVSSGDFGGARAVEHLKPIIVNFGMIVIKEVLYFPNVEELFDENSNISEDSEETYEKRVKKFLDMLTNYVEK